MMADIIHQTVEYSRCRIYPLLLLLPPWHHNQQWPHLVIRSGFYFVPLQRWHGGHNALLQFLVCGTEILLLWPRLPGGWPNYTAGSQQQTLENWNDLTPRHRWQQEISWQCPLLAPGPSCCICLFKPPQRIISSTTAVPRVPRGHGANGFS